MITDVPPHNEDLSPIAEPLQNALRISSTWRRFLAFAADTLLLYLSGRAVGAVFFELLSRMGQWGHIVGFSIALLYFGTLDSRIGNGQTVGKRLLQLRVVDANGKTISLGKSILRFSLFAAPVFLNGLELPNTWIPWIVPILVAFVAYAIGGTTLYLLLFNRHTRQGLHDLVTRSYVVNGSDTGSVEAKAIWDMHWSVLRLYLSFLMLISIGVGILENNQSKSGVVGPRIRDARLVEELEGVQTAYVRNWKPPKWISVLEINSAPQKNALEVSVFWTGKMNEREHFADQVARVILKNDASLQENDVLWIQIACGYRLGIASDEKWQSFTHTKLEWRQRLLSK